MWEPFSEQARRAVGVANDQAQRLGHHHIRAEHLLLGIAFTECATTDVLRKHGIDFEGLRAHVERLGEPRSTLSSAAMVFSPQAKRCIELAFEIARSLDDNYIGTEHLFLGILRADDRSVAMQALAQLTTDLPAIAKEVETRSRDQKRPTPHRGGRATGGFEFRLIVLAIEDPGALADHQAVLNAAGQDGFQIAALTLLSAGKVLIVMQRAS
jgi:ATP-dependent Clp protease ATP-binding subunit ClpC